MIVKLHPMPLNPDYRDYVIKKHHETIVKSADSRELL
jgi:hypothetical protein